MTSAPTASAAAVPTASAAAADPASAAAIAALLADDKQERDNLGNAQLGGSASSSSGAQALPAQPAGAEQEPDVTVTDCTIWPPMLLKVKLELVDEARAEQERARAEQEDMEHEQQVMQQEDMDVLRRTNRAGKTQQGYSNRSWPTANETEQAPSAANLPVPHADPDASPSEQ